MFPSTAQPTVVKVQDQEKEGTNLDIKVNRRSWSINSELGIFLPTSRINENEDFLWRITLWGSIRIFICRYIKNYSSLYGHSCRPPTRDFVCSGLAGKAGGTSARTWASDDGWSCFVKRSSLSVSSGVCGVDEELLYVAKIQLAKKFL